VKRRNFAVAGTFLVALLVAAVAAASVSAATSSPKAATAAGKGWEFKAGHVNSKGKNLPTQKVGTGQFAPSAPHQPKFVNSPTPQQKQDAGANKSGATHDRVIPGKLGPSGGKKAPSTPSGQAPVNVPHPHSLPITSKNYAAQKPGLNAYSQDSTGGYIDTPPDQALAEGNGSVFEAVNNVFMITDTNFGHVTNAEPMEQFWAPRSWPRATARSPTRRLTTTTRRGSGT